jgi:hypothetical protein
MDLSRPGTHRVWASSAALSIHLEVEKQKYFQIIALEDSFFADDHQQRV